MTVETPQPAQPFGRQWSASLRNGSERELRGWVESALAWCDEADAIAREHFRRDIEVERKPDRTFVTVADRAIEALVRDRIAAAFPGHGVVGEEFGTDARDAATRWYVDPIDGTHNYLRGVPLFATLLAVERDGELQAAVISAPALGERWHAWRGGGAWVTRQGERTRIATSRIGDLADASIVFASSSDLARSGEAPGIGRLIDAAWRERGFGDFWGYTLVAEGSAEAMIEVGLNPWDAAAPYLLVEESGGRATDINGDRTIHGTTFVATNGHLHDRVLAILSGRDAD